MKPYLLYYKDNGTIKLVEYDKVFDELYTQKAVIPTKNNISEYVKNGQNEKIKTYLKSKSPEEIITDIQNEISEIDYNVPLYDEYTKNLYLIKKELVYNRVTYQYYRFPDESLITLFKKRKKELEPKIKKLKDSNKTPESHYKNISLQREYRKLTLMLKFLDSFNLKILQTTYIKVFYLYANEVGKNITVCIRPSFLPHYTHIKPYYTRSELINLALNMGKIKPSNKYYDKKEVMKLCDVVKQNDISSNILLKHQEYIIKSNKIGVIQYYSLQGSYFMNKYMRGLISYPYKNELLETIINSMWGLILDAPAFDKDYILYRFIHDDSYLKDLKIGDQYIDPSFISTTRDPFYRSETYKFGFILIKIKIPKDVKGIGLCIESYSHFPEEEEIILPPLSILQLDKKDENAMYYHTDDIFASRVRTRYEFTLLENDDITFSNRPLLPKDEVRVIDFLQIEKFTTLTIYEKIKRFIEKYANKIYQIRTKIGNTEYDLIVEWYDSTSAYKEFYANTTKNGFSIYTINNNYITFFIEIGEDKDVPIMYVNYYFRYASTNPVKNIKDDDFVEFLSKLAYYFDIKNIILYAEYSSCDLGRDIENQKYDQTYRGGNYCADYYKYLKFNEKRFKLDSTELKTQFSYYELDRLKTIDPLDEKYKVLRHDDRDELYQIYTKTYKNFFDITKQNLADFYVWLVEYYCVNVNLLVQKISRVYNVNNPFENDYYILDAAIYLYNRDLISEYNLEIQRKEINEIARSDREPKNEYRLQYYRRPRVPVEVK